MVSSFHYKTRPDTREEFFQPLENNKHSLKEVKEKEKSDVMTKKYIIGNSLWHNV